jgi:hypothetical protein
LPTSILGLPVYTVAGISRLAANGSLDGRFAAVAGYWAQFALPCPFMPHQPAVLGFCSGGSFADTPEAARNQGGSVNGPVPVSVRETANGSLLWSLGQSSGDPGSMGVGSVALIVHRADSRAWQCAPNDRAACHSRLVIDNVAWVNGSIVAAPPDMSHLDGASPALSIDQVIAAAVQPGQQLVTAYPLKGSAMNDVDPRFVGLADGVVWYVRVISGPPDADGIAPGKDVLVDDATGTVVSTLPLEVDAAYKPARIVLDAKGWEGPVGNPVFTLSVGTEVRIAGDLGAGTEPILLDAGDYKVHAFINTPQANPVAGPTCDLDLTVAAGDDVSYFANFSAGSGDCTWVSGSLFPV